MPKHCVFSDCKSDSRFHPWLKFAAFVKPTKPENIERAKRWIHLLEREDFCIEKINKDTYICEKHFPEEKKNLDWKTNPNLTPFPADINLDALHNDSSEIVEEIANTPSDTNDLKTDKHFKKNKKKERHFKKKDFEANFPIVRKYYFYKNNKISNTFFFTSNLGFPKRKFMGNPIYL